MVLTRIGVASLGKVLAGIYGFLGLIFGVIFALASLLGAGIASEITGSSEPWLGVVFGIGAVIALPLFYGVLGGLMGLLVAALYNFIARRIGGIELDLR